LILEVFGWRWFREKAEVERCMPLKYTHFINVFLAILYVLLDVLIYFKAPIWHHIDILLFTVFCVIYAMKGHHVQTGSGSHPTSYPLGTRNSFPGDEATRA
jgi:hypothetical protein